VILEPPPPHRFNKQEFHCIFIVILLHCSNCMGLLILDSSVAQAGGKQGEDIEMEKW
jgi:hypothetical protein